MKRFALPLILVFAANAAWAQRGANSWRRAGRTKSKSDSVAPKKTKRSKSKTLKEMAPEAAPVEKGSKEKYTFTDDAKAVAFSLDGRYAAARGPDGGPDRIKIWDTQEQKMLHVIEAGWSGTPETLAFSPDGDTLASGEGSDVSFWDLETGNRWRRFEDKSPSSGPLAFDPKTKFFAAVMGSRVLIWPLEQKRRKEENVALTWPDSAQIRALSFSPDGKKLAAIGFRSPRHTRGQIEILDPTEGGVIKTLQDAEVGFFCGEFSRNGRVLVAAGLRPTPEGPRAELVFWSVKTWKVIRRIRTNINGEVLSVAFSPDGLAMAAVIGGHSGMPVFDLRTGKLVRTIPGVEVERSGDVAVSPDGKLVTATAHKEIRFWTAAAVFGVSSPPKAKPRKKRRTSQRRRRKPRQASAPTMQPMGGSPAPSGPMDPGSEDEGPVDSGETQDNP